MSRPSKRMRPASGAISPASWPISVVLPAPLGPMMACSSPVRHAKRNRIRGDDAAEALGQRLDLAAADQPRRAPASSPSMPPRANSTTSRNSGPSTICQYSAMRSAASPNRGDATTRISTGSASSSDSSATAPISGPNVDAHAAEHDHDDEIARARPVHRCRTDESGVIGEQRAGEPADRAGDDERGETIAKGRKADRPHAAVVRAGALDHHAEPRIHQPGDEIDGDDQQRQAQIVELRSRSERLRRPANWLRRRMVSPSSAP